MRSDTGIHDASPGLALDGEEAGVLAVDREDGFPEQMFLDGLGNKGSYTSMAWHSLWPRAIDGE